MLKVKGGVCFLPCPVSESCGSNPLLSSKGGNSQYNLSHGHYCCVAFCFFFLALLLRGPQDEIMSPGESWEITVKVNAIFISTCLVKDHGVGMSAPGPLFCLLFLSLFSISCAFPPWGGTFISNQRLRHAVTGAGWFHSSRLLSVANLDPPGLQFLPHPHLQWSLLILMGTGFIIPNVLLRALSEYYLLLDARWSQTLFHFINKILTHKTV